MKRLLPVAAAVVVLLFSGLVHGLWTERWAEAADLNEAAARLNQMPLVVGDWQGERLPQKNKSSALAGSLVCRYVHRHTAKEVTVYLGVGRPGKVAIHTPDVCYTASGFDGDTKAEFTLPAGSPAAGATFYTTRFKKTQAADRTQLRIFWSWHAGGKWQVAENPRFAFVGQPVLHKLYVIREMGSGPEPLSEDPCLDLMNQLLPVLEKTALAGS